MDRKECVGFLGKLFGHKFRTIDTTSNTCYRCGLNTETLNRIAQNLVLKGPLPPAPKPPPPPPGSGD